MSCSKRYHRACSLPVASYGTYYGTYIRPPHRIKPHTTSSNTGVVLLYYSNRVAPIPRTKKSVPGRTAVLSCYYEYLILRSIYVLYSDTLLGMRENVSNAPNVNDDYHRPHETGRAAGLEGKRLCLVSHPQCKKLYLYHNTRTANSSRFLKYSHDNIVLDILLVTKHRPQKDCRALRAQ